MGHGKTLVEETQGIARAQERLGVVLLVLAIAGIAALLQTTVIPGLVPPPRPVTLPWPLLVAAFGLTEATAVRVEFRGNAQALSLSELPLVAGLFFADHTTVIACGVIGTAGALVLARHQRGLKFLFNLATMWLSLLTAETVFYALRPASEELTTASWAASLVATQAAALVTIALVAVIMRIVDGDVELARFRDLLALGSLGSLMSTSLGLVGVTLLWYRLSAGWLLALPAVAIYATLHLYTSEKAKHDGLELLYEASRILHGHPQIDEAIVALLGQARETFRSETAEVVLFPASSDDQMVRTVSARNGTSVVEPVPVSMDDDGGPHGLVTVTGSKILDRDDPSAAGRYLATRGHRNGMVIPMVGESRILGVMLVADRVGEGSYRAADLRLLETMAGQLSTSLEHGHLEKALEHLTRLKEELRHQAYHDPLTGLANRKYLTERLELALQAHGGTPGSVWLLYVDLDDFKWVNDTYGHEIGDRLLVQVAERLASATRHADLVARIGGDEFAILMSGVLDHHQLPVVAHRIAMALREPFEVHDHELHIRASVGIASNDHRESASDLINNADIAMYDIKRSGKSHFAVYDPRMRERIMERVQLRQDLIRATDDGQFHIHYQPLFSLQTGDITGTEALVRWTHPTRGPVQPDDFLTVAEETGLILPIGELVMLDACRQTAEWSRTLRQPLSINVNLSPRQVLHAGLPRLVERALTQSGLDPWQLVLEITEHEMLESCGSSLATLAALKELGVRIAIDDFGTGYSALAYLRTLPLDILKIPKPFVDDIETEDGGLLAHAIIEMSRALGLRTVAEGIETPLQFSRLKDWGCDIGQGFMVSPPDSAPMIQRFLTAEITRMRRNAAPAEPSSETAPPTPVSSATTA